MIVHQFESANAPAWEQYVRAAPDATICHLPAWSRVIERSWQHTPHFLYAERAGEVAGVLPVFHVRSRLFGSKLVSLPNAVYGGAVADDSDAHLALVAAAVRLARQLRVQYLELRDAAEAGQPVEGALLQGDLYVDFHCPLSGDEEAMMAGLPRDVRRMIRQGPKHGLSAETGGAALLDEFYEVYATSVRNLGTPVFPRRLFANFLDEFQDDADILLIRQGARVAGGVLSFYFRDTVLPYYGGAYPDFYRTGVNNFMYWELMCRAARRGCRRFDFGRSKLGTGAYHFKRGWGMTERPLAYRFFLVGARRLPNLTPLNPRLDPFIRAWKSLPVAVTKLAGPVIVRGLP